MSPPTAPPTIALSAHWHAYPERFRWIEEHGFALEYTPNPEAFQGFGTNPALLEHLRSRPGMEGWMHG